MVPGPPCVLRLGFVLGLLPWSGAFDPQPDLYAPPHPLAAGVEEGLEVRPNPGDELLLLPLEEWTAVGGTYSFEHVTTIPQTDVDIRATALVSAECTFPFPRAPHRLCYSLFCPDSILYLGGLCGGPCTT